MTWNSLRKGATLVKRSWIAGLLVIVSLPVVNSSTMAQTIIIGGQSGQAVQTFSPYAANQYRYYQPGLPYRASRLPVFGQAPLRTGPGLLPLQKRLRLAPLLSPGSAKAPVLKAPVQSAKAPALRAPAVKAQVIAAKKPAPIATVVKPTTRAPVIAKKPALKVTPPPIKKPVTTARKPAVKADPSELKMPAAPQDKKQPIIATKIAPPPAAKKPAAEPAVKPAAKQVVKTAKTPVPTAPAPTAKPPIKTAALPKIEAPAIAAPKAIIAKKEDRPAEVAAVAPKTTTAVVKPSAPGTNEGPVSLSFGKGDQKLTSAEKAKLDSFYTSIAGKNIKIQLVAYADAGSSSASRRLSLSRALTVRSHLMNLGMANTSIEVRALGLPKNNDNPDRVDLKMLDR